MSDSAEADKRRKQKTKEKPKDKDGKLRPLDVVYALVDRNRAKALAARKEERRKDLERQLAREELVLEEIIREEEEEAREEAARAKGAASEEVARQESAHQEAARQEVARQEAARQEVARQEAARQEAARQEAARQEAVHQDIVRQEAARQEAVRQSAARQEAARQESLRQQGLIQQAVLKHQAELKKRQQDQQQAAAAQERLVKAEAARIQKEQLDKQALIDQATSRKRAELEQRQRDQQQAAIALGRFADAQAELIRRKEEAYREAALQQAALREQAEFEAHQGDYSLAALALGRFAREERATASRQQSGLEGRRTDSGLTAVVDERFATQEKAARARELEGAHQQEAFTQSASKRQSEAWDSTANVLALEQAAKDEAARIQRLRAQQADQQARAAQLSFRQQVRFPGDEASRQEAIRLKREQLIQEQRAKRTAAKEQADLEQRRQDEAFARLALQQSAQEEAARKEVLYNQQIAEQQHFQQQQEEENRRQFAAQQEEAARQEAVRAQELAYQQALAAQQEEKARQRAQELALQQALAAQQEEEAHQRIEQLARQQALEAQQRRLAAQQEEENRRAALRAFRERSLAQQQLHKQQEDEEAQRRRLIAQQDQEARRQEALRAQQQTLQEQQAIESKQQQFTARREEAARQAGIRGQELAQQQALQEQQASEAQRKHLEAQEEAARQEAIRNQELAQQQALAAQQEEQARQEALVVQLLAYQQAIEAQETQRREALAYQAHQEVVRQWHEARAQEEAARIRDIVERERHRLAVQQYALQQGPYGSIYDFARTFAPPPPPQGPRATKISAPPQKNVSFSTLRPVDIKGRFSPYGFNCFGKRKRNWCGLEEYDPLAYKRRRSTLKIDSRLELNPQYPVGYSGDIYETISGKVHRLECMHLYPDDPPKHLYEKTNRIEATELASESAEQNSAEKPKRRKSRKRSHNEFAEGEKDIEYQDTRPWKQYLKDIFHAGTIHTVEVGCTAANLAIDYNVKAFVHVSRRSGSLANRVATRTYKKTKGAIEKVTSEGQRYASATMFSAKRQCVEWLSNIYKGAELAQKAMFLRGGRLPEGDAANIKTEDPIKEANNSGTPPDPVVAVEETAKAKMDRDDVDSIQDFEWNDNPDLNRPISLDDIKARKDRNVAVESKDKSEDEHDASLDSPTKHSRKESAGSSEEPLAKSLAWLGLDETKDRPLRLQPSTKRTQLRIRDKQERERKAREEVERLEREARLKEERLGRVEPTEGHNLFSSLPADLEERVQTAFKSPAHKQMSATTEGTELLAAHFQTLRPGQWLNDEIINGAMSLYVDHAQKHFEDKRSETPTIQALGSHFYTQMVNKGDGTVAGTHGSVKRWATRKKIGGKAFLECSLVLTPVNHGNAHWTLLAFWPKRKVVEYYDSFRGDASEVFGISRLFLEGELGSLYDESEWSYRIGKSPRQANGYDCGVFACTTAKMLILGYEPEISYTGSDMAGQRKRIAAELLAVGMEGELEPTFADAWLKG